jgi:hypothetical protein
VFNGPYLSVHCIYFSHTFAWKFVSKPGMLLLLNRHLDLTYVHCSIVSYFLLIFKAARETVTIPVAVRSKA